MEAVGVPVEVAGSPKGALEEAAVAGLKTGANAAAEGWAGTSVSAAGVRAKDGAAGGSGVAVIRGSGAGVPWSDGATAEGGCLRHWQ
jgi:hypothetical protein